MSFVEAVRVCFSKYVTFTGRARRSEYWWFVLFGGLVYIVAAILSTAANSSVFVVIAVLALLLPTLAVLVRRLHDTSRSGWWYFISRVPLVGGIMLVYLASDSTPGPNEYGEHHQGGYLEGSQYQGGPYPGGQYQGQPPALVRSGPNLNRNDLVVLGAGALMFVVSLLPWYGASYLGSSISTTAWDAGVGAWGR